MASKNEEIRYIHYFPQKSPPPQVPAADTASNELPGARTTTSVAADSELDFGPAFTPSQIDVLKSAPAAVVTRRERIEKWMDQTTPIPPPIEPNLSDSDGWERAQPRKRSGRGKSPPEGSDSWLISGHSHY